MKKIFMALCLAGITSGLWAGIGIVYRPNYVQSGDRKVAQFISLQNREFQLVSTVPVDVQDGYAKSTDLYRSPGDKTMASLRVSIYADKVPLQQYYADLAQKERSQAFSQSRPVRKGEKQIAFVRYEQPFEDQIKRINIRILYLTGNGETDPYMVERAESLSVYIPLENLQQTETWINAAVSELVIGKVISALHE